MATTALPSPYAERIASVPVRVGELALRGSTATLRSYGPPDAPRRIVFLHGLRGDHHGLEPIVAHLAGTTVLVPDLPGFGGSPPMPASRRICST